MNPVQTVAVRGFTQAYLEAGKGPLVILLHGFPDTAHTWSDTLGVLAAAGYRAVAPFQRGYYPSDIPVDGDYSVQALAEDALALATALGQEHFMLVGHDWGASAAYVAANLAPERISKLTTIAIPHARAIKPSPRLFWRAPHFLLFQFGRISEKYVERKDYAYIDHLYHYWSPNWRVQRADIEVVKAGFRQAGRLGAALGYYRALFADARKPERQTLYRSKTSVPTLAFAGRSDGALDTALYEQTPAAFTGPYEYLIYERAGHFLHREEPEAFHAKLLEFLAK